MQLALTTTIAASLAALTAPELFAALKTARDGRDGLLDAAQSMDIRLGPILSAIEDKRTGGTLAKFVKENTGIDSRDIGHAYKACVVYRALVKAGGASEAPRAPYMPEAVYCRALPSWVVPASAVCNALDEPAHAEKKPAILAKLAALFTAGKKGDDTTAKIDALKTELLGTPENKPTKAEKEKAEMQAKLDAAEEKVRQAEENGKAHMRQMAEAEENGRVMLGQLRDSQTANRKLADFIAALVNIESAHIEMSFPGALDIIEPMIGSLPATAARDNLLAAIHARRESCAAAPDGVVLHSADGKTSRTARRPRPEKAAKVVEITPAALPEHAQAA